MSINGVLKKYSSKPSIVNGCVVAIWIAELPKEEQETLNLLKSKAIVITDLHRDLVDAGFPFKITSFRSHMKGYCSCPKV